MEFSLKRTLKALLYSTSEPLSIRDVQSLISRYHNEVDIHRKTANDQDSVASDNEGERQRWMQELINQVPSLVTATQIRAAIQEIQEDLEERKEVYQMQEGPNGYRLVIAPAYSVWIRLLRNETKPLRLSSASMETVAIVAYRQPATRSEIEAIRGVSSDSALNTLMEHELVYVTGRADLPGRPIQYSTTERFLEFCGLRSIEELPASDVLTPNEITEWIRKASRVEGELGDADVGLPEAARDA